MPNQALGPLPEAQPVRRRIRQAAPGGSVRRGQPQSGARGGAAGDRAEQRCACRRCQLPCVQPRRIWGCTAATVDAYVSNQCGHRWGQPQHLHIGAGCRLEISSVYCR